MKASAKLKTTNPQHLTFQHPPLDISVLGGIRLDGLDRMRSTLKITVEHLSLRHSLDLYNHSQVEKLVRSTAEKLEVGTSVIASALDKLTDELERYRLAEMEKEIQEQDKRKFLSPTETKAAKLYLSSPNLIERTNQDIGKAGVIGEEMNRVLMYLIFTSRKMNSPLHIISLGSSGAGKTHLQEKLGQLMPEEDVIEITKLSTNAFYYFGRQQLRNKLILIEDLDGADEVLYPLREIKSKKKLTKTVVVKNTKGETRTVTLTVEGPVSIAGCTTHETIYEDNANRSFLIHIDESEAQDEKIMDYQRAVSAGKVDKAAEYKVAESFRNMQRILQPVTIRNAFAPYLKIPKEVFKPRRTNAHYLAFIEAVTFYHQYQREKCHDPETGEEYIETTIEDIKEANTLMKEVLLQKSDPLPGACRQYFEALKNYLQTKGEKAYTAREIMRELRVKETTLRRYHKQLELADFIRIKRGKKYKGYHYELINEGDYKELKSKIDQVLDGILDKLPSATRQASAKTRMAKPNTRKPKS